MKLYLVKSDQETIAILLNIFNNEPNKYYTCYNVGSVMVKDVLRALNIAIAMSDNTDFKNELQIIKNKLT